MEGTTAKLLEMIQKSIAKTVTAKKIGVAFSGGVDSSLISKICSDMNFDIILLTVGFSASHDILFANKVANLLHLPHKSLEIDPETFPDISKRISKKINTPNLSWAENCIAFYYISKLARHLGLNMVITANGIDELFCGYDVYRKIFSQGDSGIADTMDAKLENEIAMLKAVNFISSEFNVQIVQPLLATEFIQYAKTVPIYEKIRGPDDLLRKHAIRKLARKMGVPKISYSKRKKALQYGSKIHKMLLKTR